jgi:hypothetical protein
LRCHVACNRARLQRYSYQEKKKRLISTEEMTVWSETASMRDFYVDPRHWFFTLLTVGIYAGVVYVCRYYTRVRGHLMLIVFEN